MSGVTPLLPVYAIMGWTGTLPTLPLLCSHIKRRQICHSLMYLHKKPMHIYTTNAHPHTTYAGAHVTFHYTNFDCQLDVLGITVTYEKYKFLPP
jgi:hypothetical protein